MGQGKKLTQLANIRTLAIFLVVLGHSIILYSSAWDLYETAVSVPFLDYVKKLIDIPQMLLFFSLSGYLFVFTHNKKQGLVHLLKNKALRLLVPYLSIGLGFMLPIRIAIGYPAYRGMGILEVLQKFLTSADMGHLWFLPALFCAFLLSEVILSIGEKIPGIRRYPEIFLCVVAFALYLEGYRIGFGYAPLLSAFSYLLWFGLGYFINAHRALVQKIYSFCLVKWMLIVLNLGLMAYAVFVGPLRLVLSLLMNGLCVLNAYGAISDKSCKIAEKIDRNSFGVYLFHSPLIYITYATIPNASPLIVVFVNLVIFGAAAYGLTRLVRKTKLKVLIGE